MFKMNKRTCNESSFVHDVLLKNKHDVARMNASILLKFLQLHRFPNGFNVIEDKLPISRKKNNY